MRIDAWGVDGSLADPAGEAFKCLLAAGLLARLDPEPLGSCSGEAAEFVVFGGPARAIRAETSRGSRATVTAGHAYGSLIAIVADAGAGNAGPRCAQTTAMDSAIRQLTASLTPTGDPSRPVVPPTIIDLGSRPSVEIPPPDPSAPP